LGLIDLTVGNHKALHISDCREQIVESDQAGHAVTMTTSMDAFAAD
jgi:hypothetical protein